MSFKLFTGKHDEHPRSPIPMITITKTGNLYMNVVCTKKYIIKKKSYINLLYDIDKKVIGLKSIEKPKLYSYTIRQLNNRTATIISLRSFLEYYKIPYKGITQRYLATWNDKEKLIEIKL